VTVDSLEKSGTAEGRVQPCSKPANQNGAESARISYHGEGTTVPTDLKKRREIELAHHRSGNLDRGTGFPREKSINVS